MDDSKIIVSIVKIDIKSALPTLCLSISLTVFLVSLMLNAYTSMKMPGSGIDNFLSALPLVGMFGLVWLFVPLVLLFGCNYVVKFGFDFKFESDFEFGEFAERHTDRCNMQQSLEADQTAAENNQI